jgi:hypothetical protein
MEGERRYENPREGEKSGERGEMVGERMLENVR